MKALRYVDKSKWLDGPWSNEPDLMFYEDRATKLSCLIARHEGFGNLNGYVGVDESHPAFKKDYDKVISQLKDIDYTLVPRIVFSGFRNDDLRHLGMMKDSRKIWWFGFDNLHAKDVNPIDGIWAEVTGVRILPGYYKNIDHVKKQLANLACELARYEN